MLLKTVVTNKLKEGKTFTWITEGLWIDAGASVELNYDLVTKAELEGKQALLSADLAEGRIEISYRVDKNIKVVNDLDNIVLPLPPPPESKTIAQLKADQENAIKKEPKPNKPEILKDFKDSRKDPEYNVSDLLWNRDKENKVEPMKRAEPLILTSERMAIFTTTPARPSEPKKI